VHKIYFNLKREILLESMAITVKEVSEMFGKDVFTSKGYYAGRVKDLELDLSRFKLKSIIVETSPDSVLSAVVGGKKGVIVPYALVLAVGDIVIIKHVVTGTAGEGEISQTEAGLEKA
jgi:sporulation protein YlmC with PRC-barrel domain